MKKASSVFIIILLFVNVFSMSVNAQDLALTQEEQQALYLKFTNHFGYDPNEKNEQGDPCNVFSVKSVYSGYAICYAAHKPWEQIPATGVYPLVSYCVFYEGISNPSTTGIIIISLENDNVYTLDEAIKAGLLNMLYPVAKAFPDQVRLRGDLDKNQKISLNDMLILQRYFAKVTVINGSLDLAVADFSDDGVINIKDVIDMQKMLAHAW